MGTGGTVTPDLHELLAAPSRASVLPRERLAEVWAEVLELQGQIASLQGNLLLNLLGSPAAPGKNGCSASTISSVDDN